MNEIYIRMKTLLEGAGLSFDEGGISCAELKAYAKGLQYVKDCIDSAENALLLNGSEIRRFINYADMLRIDSSRFSAQTLKDEIKRRLSLPFAYSSYTQADAQFSPVLSGEYALTQNTCVVIGVRLGDLKEAGKFLAAYSPFCAERLYSGEGSLLTFDMWDSIGYTFNGYDSLHLPCEFLESLRSDIFEQH